MGCTISDTLKSKASGTSHASTCDVGSMNVGCGYDAPANDTTSYGDAFNAAGGGVYAMEWDAEYIKIWHFSRNQIPGDISAKKPMPEEWGLPHAIFGGKSCDVDTHFKNMNLVINIVSFFSSSFFSSSASNFSCSISVDELSSFTNHAACIRTFVAIGPTASGARRMAVENTPLRATSS